jgi:hypothetical protein
MILSPSLNSIIVYLKKRAKAPVLMEYPSLFYNISPLYLLIIYIISSTTHGLKTIFQNKGKPPPLFLLPNLTKPILFSIIIDQCHFLIL